MTPRPIAVVGGGLAGQRCVEALRRAGHASPIVLVCGEAVPPYDQPPLSKELLAGTTSGCAARRDTRTRTWSCCSAGRQRGAA